MMMMLMMMVSLIIPILMMMLNFILTKKMMKNREKSSPFECGFDNQSINRLPFSLQFYLISVIFLIFDVEITIILPMMFYDYNYLLNKFYLNLILIILILIFGLFIEWYEGALNWFK
nr:NADH dehydrogenase subunit 3 [Odontofroggatia galili]